MIWFDESQEHVRIFYLIEYIIYLHVYVCIFFFLPVAKMYSELFFFLNCAFHAAVVAPPLLPVAGRPLPIVFTTWGSGT